MRWSQEQESSGVTQSPNPPFIDRHTWLEEMHTWIQTNAHATSLVMLETRMKTMKSPPSLNFEGHEDVKHPSCLAVVINGVFIDRFGTSLNI